jgi:hypothetical protein
MKHIDKDCLGLPIGPEVDEDVVGMSVIMYEPTLVGCRTKARYGIDQTTGCTALIASRSALHPLPPSIREANGTDQTFGEQSRPQR